MPKRIFFLLEGTVSIIKFAEENPNHSSRQLAGKFNCGGTNIQTIFKKLKKCSFLLENQRKHSF